MSVKINSKGITLTGNSVVRDGSGNIINDNINSDYIVKQRNTVNPNSPMVLQHDDEIVSTKIKFVAGSAIHFDCHCGEATIKLV